MSNQREKPVNRAVVYFIIAVISGAITPDWSLPPILILSSVLIVVFELVISISRRSKHRLSS